MIDAATSDEDKVSPVYKLEELCELFRSSPSGIVKEVSEFLLKRLDHKSPIVKQKVIFSPFLCIVLELDEFVGNTSRVRKIMVIIRGLGGPSLRVPHEFIYMSGHMG